MYQIYAEEAYWYDQLIAREDRQRSLPEALAGSAPWDGALVLEAGVGTGRVTRNYASRAARIVATDRSQHMLARAAVNLSQWSDRISYLVSDNLDLPSKVRAAERGSAPRTESRGSDAALIFVEGWSFGHVVVDHSDEVESTTARLVAGADAAARELGAVSEASEGARTPWLLFIETLGTGTSTPEAPSEALSAFYELLERKHGFIRNDVRTDFKFETLDEAIELMGFFFGAAMAEAVRARGSTIVREFTGIWQRAGARG